MLPKKHIIFGFAFSLIFYLIYPSINFLEASIVFLSSFLIDFDHYLYYVFKKKDLSPRNAVKWFKQKSKKLKKLPREKRKKLATGFYLFHGIETILVLFLAGFFIHTIFYFILIGSIFHLILDQFDRLNLYRHPTKISILFDLIYSKKLEKF